MHTKKMIALLGCCLLLQAAYAQKTAERPKIVIGMMVDQMRWDFLYRYGQRYTQGGFKRMLREGFSCENTLINYAPTVTACGHSSVYTGSVPAVHGIIDNGWYSRELKREVYCAEDTTVQPVGIPGTKGGMSPRNMQVTTITDELRVATGFESKVVGFALKDRGAIFPAGHSANAAFWYDGGSGKVVTSSYYMKELPAWVQQFNDKKLPEKLLANGWNTMYPVASYKLSEADNKDYENKFGHEAAPVFPHQFKGKENSSVRSTPYGNTLTFEFAKAAIEGYNLGGGQVTDFLAVSFSSPDAVGHQFGPNSIEVEDVYLRMDKELEAFFSWLDQRFGKNNYLFFITADHGVSHSPGYLEEKKLPTGLINGKAAVAAVNKTVEARFGVPDAVLDISAYQVYLNRKAFAEKGIDMSLVEKTVVQVLKEQPGVAAAIPLSSLGSAAIPEPAKTMFINGYNEERGGDVLVVYKSGWKDGSRNGATHGLWYPYDAHIPLVWMGWGIKPGKTHRTTGMTDIAPTLAALLHIQMPSGNVGQVVTELFR
ncbi:alkaline phosphatase family protein [Chitinophaga lutea]|uniref:Alkaline phosphatase family protein n=1 Tax=Chitinophaga lutea TaxID=2488634 RepID=A0A3N4PLG2_9BACT|nr:alkaline phosphatase PafA [Chitinophaga lutea]RPE08645.1 alkaline phosphatase family protein [Chitinophaga lutea]